MTTRRRQSPPSAEALEVPLPRVAGPGLVLADAVAAKQPLLEPLAKIGKLVERGDPIYRLEPGAGVVLRLAVAEHSVFEEAVAGHPLAAPRLADTAGVDELLALDDPAELDVGVAEKARQGSRCPWREPSADRRACRVDPVLASPEAPRDAETSAHPPPRTPPPAVADAAARSPRGPKYRGSTV